MKVSTTGYKRNSKDKKHKQLFIPGDQSGNTNLTMLGVDHYVQATPVYPNGNFGGSVMMRPGVPTYNFPGAMGVIEQKLPKAQKGLTWAEYLKKRGVTDKDMLALTQEQIDQGLSGLEKPEAVNNKYDIKNDIYNNALSALLGDYNRVYPLSSDGSRSVIKNIMSNFHVNDEHEALGLTEKQAEDLYRKASIDPALNQKYIDAYFNITNKYNTQELKDRGDAYRDVPVKWVDAYPKQTLKGIPNTNTEFPGQQRVDVGNMFRMPILYDDKTLGQQDIPLLGADWMRDYYNRAPGTEGYHDRSSRESHTNPAIYPKPSYSIQEANPVLSGIPNYGSSFTINGQDYTIAQPDQNYIQNQFYGIPATAMPGPSAENIFVDNPDSPWVQNYKNKMGLYDLTQQNLARLAEYDPNYKIQSAPITEDDRRVIEYENQYINNPNVGFYQISDEQNDRKPCKNCNTLQGSTSSSDASNYYQTYDVQYPQYDIFKKEDLEPKPRYYIERSREYGNPGVAHIYRADLTDPTNPHNRDYLGAVLADEWLSGDTLENFYRSGYQYREPIDYEALKDGRRVWKAGTENPDELEPYAILDQRAKEPAERGARELYKKRMQEISDMELGDPETESRRKQYVKEKLGMLNNYIDNLNAPRKRGRHYSGPSFKDGGSLPKAQKGLPIYVESKNDPQYIQYQKDLSHYNKQKSKFNSIPILVSTYGTYDNYVKSYYTDPYINTHINRLSHLKYDPHLGYEFYWQNSTEPDYAFKKPEPVIYQEPLKLEPKGIFALPTPKPLPIIQKTLLEPPVLPPSPYGVTDLGGNIGMIRKDNGVVGYVPLDKFFGTQKQLGNFYNDPKKSTREGYTLSRSDFDEWSSIVPIRGNADDVKWDIYDDNEKEYRNRVHKSKMAKGGSLPKAQTIGELKQQALERFFNRQQAKAWDPNETYDYQEEPLDYNPKTGEYTNWKGEVVRVETKPMVIGSPKGAPKKSKAQIEKEKAVKYDKQTKVDPTLWLQEHPEYMLDANGNPILRSMMEQAAPEELKEADIKQAKEEFVKDLNSDPLQQSLGTASLDNPVTNAAAENYANYKVNNIDPGRASDQLFRGYAAPTTRDFYQPHNVSNTLRGAAGLGATAAGITGLSYGLAALPALGEAAYAWGAANPFISATGAALTASPAALPGASLANLANAGFITHGVSQLPETYEAWNNAINNGGSYLDAAGQTLLNSLDFLGVGELKAPGILDDIVGKSIKEASAAGVDPAKVFVENLGKEGIIKPEAISNFTKEQWQEAAKFLERRQFVKQLQKDRLIGEGVKPADINYFARSNDRTSRLTQNALNADATLYRGVRGNKPHAGYQEYTGREYDMMKPAWGNEISEYENMVRAGVDFENPLSIAEYQATHVPMESYGYRAGMPDMGKVDAIYATSEPSDYYGNYLFEIKLPRDYSKGSFKDWYDKYFKGQQYFDDVWNAEDKAGRNIYSYVTPINKEMPLRLSRSGYPTVIGRKGEKLLSVNKDFPFTDLKRLNTDPEYAKAFNEYREAVRNNYNTGWLDKIKQSESPEYLNSLQNEYNSLTEKGVENLTQDELLKALDLETKLNKATGTTAEAGEILGAAGDAPTRSPEERYKKMMEFFSMPDSKSKSGQSMLAEFQQRIRTPEGQQRLKDLGITNPQIFEGLFIKEVQNELGYFTPNFGVEYIGLHKDIPEAIAAKITRHELEHAVQKALSRQAIPDPLYPRVPWLAKPAGLTEVDDILSNLTFKGTPSSTFTRRLTSEEPIPFPSNQELFSDAQRNLDYFVHGSSGKERAPFLAEVQQSLVENKLIDNVYQNITPQKVEEAYNLYMKDASPDKYKLRLFEIIEPTGNNFNDISKGLNKMLGLTGVGIGIGAATQQKKKGGKVAKYNSKALDDYFTNAWASSRKSS